MKDMIETTDHDFKVVNAISIAAISLIITLVEGSFSLPFILIAVIELAIFINLGPLHALGQSLPFIAPICISTIQLGATVDYAILMTTRYKAERLNGEDKKKAVMTALRTSALHHRQRHGPVRRHLRRGAVFQHRYRGLHVYADGPWRYHQCAAGAAGAAGSADPVRRHRVPHHPWYDPSHW